MFQHTHCSMTSNVQLNELKDALEKNKGYGLVRGSWLRKWMLSSSSALWLSSSLSLVSSSEIWAFRSFTWSITS